MEIKALQAQFRGEILTPGTVEYEASRRIWNDMINRRPAAIVRCSGPADVRAAVRFAVDHGIYPAIRGGGHNVAGLAMVDDGLVIDLTRMKGIYVDPVHHTATAQMGLTWGEFDRETQLYGLATTGGLISTTGIAGLTLGGGVGWLLGRCGLACDNTLSYDIVLSSGELVRANVNEHTDLFWALKGCVEILPRFCAVGTTGRTHGICCCSLDSRWPSGSWAYSRLVWRRPRSGGASAGPDSEIRFADRRFGQ
jgi:FAD/FMN-containing dehydrogenase